MSSNGDNADENVCLWGRRTSGIQIYNSIEKCLFCIFTFMFLHQMFYLSLALRRLHVTSIAGGPVRKFPLPDTFSSRFNPPSDGRKRVNVIRPLTGEQANLPTPSVWGGDSATAERPVMKVQ